MRTAACLLATLLLGCGGTDAPRASILAPPQWLEPEADQQVAIAAPGAARVSEFYRGAAWKNTRDRVDLYVPLQQQTCYWFSGVGGESIDKLHLYLWDPAQERVATAKVDGSRALLSYCPTASGMYHLQAKVARGQGYFVVGTYAKSTAPPREKVVIPPPPPTEAPAPEPAPAPGVATDLRTIADQQAASQAPGAARIAPHYEASTATGPKSEWFMPLDPANCYWFVGVTSAGVKDLSLVLSDPTDKKVVENRSSNSTVVLGHCPKTSGMYHLRAKVEGGDGAYAVGVYARPGAHR